LHCGCNPLFGCGGCIRRGLRLCQITTIMQSLFGLPDQSLLFQSFFYCLDWLILLLNSEPFTFGYPFFFNPLSTDWISYITPEFRTFDLWIWIHNIKLRCLTSLEPHFLFSCTCRCNDAAPSRGLELRTFYPCIQILNQNTKPRRCLTSNPCHWNIISFFMYMKV